MCTQTQAQRHAKQCGMVGKAVPIPVGRDRVTDTWILAEEVTHPVTLERIVHKGATVTGYLLDALAECYGLDYVVTL